MDCMKQIRRYAKAGKEKGKFSVYPEDVKMLENMGFAVVKPKNYREENRKNPREVLISWENPSCEGPASQLNKLVRVYRYRYNAIERTCQIKSERQEKLDRQMKLEGQVQNLEFECRTDNEDEDNNSNFTWLLCLYDLIYEDCGLQIRQYS